MSTRCRFFRAPWLRLLGAWLILSAALPIPFAGAAQAADPAAAERAQRLTAARSDVEFAATLADSIVAQVGPLCRSAECTEAVSKAGRVAARQRALLQQRPDFDVARVQQGGAVLTAALGRVVVAFEADYPEYKDRIERGGEMGTLTTDELMARSRVDSSSVQPIIPDAASVLGPSGTECGPPGCSRSKCRTQCAQLAQNFSYICAAYAFVCPACAAICLLVLAQQLAKCNARCDACPNP